MIIDHPLLTPQKSPLEAVFENITPQKTAEEEIRQLNSEHERKVEKRTIALKQSSAMLRTSEERYRAVLEDQTEIISRNLPDGTYTFVNEVYCRFFGKTSEELVGRGWQPEVFDEDLPHLHTLLRRLSPTTPVVTIENRVHDATGAIRWVHPPVPAECGAGDGIGSTAGQGVRESRADGMPSVGGGRSGAQSTGAPGDS